MTQTFFNSILMLFTQFLRIIKSPLFWGLISIYYFLNSQE
nr:MAG TPA: hypothetical protein [Caudoviricetes sp.]